MMTDCTKSLVFIMFWLRFGVYAQNQEANKNDTKFETPEYILPCYKADPNIDKCLQGTFNHLRPYLVNGLSDLDVPSIDPFKLEKIIMENGQGPLKIKAAFYNVTANGAQNYSVERINANVDDYIIEIGFKFPRMDIRGKYDVNGNVLLFPVRSKGDFWAIFLDIDAAAKIFGKEFVRDNVRYMKIEKMLVDFRLKKSRFRIRDLINNGNVIGEAMNNFLNNNSEEIIKEMKPAARLSIAKHFKGFLNSAFMQLPLQVWLPDAMAYPKWRAKIGQFDDPLTRNLNLTLIGDTVSIRIRWLDTWKHLSMYQSITDLLLNMLQIMVFILGKRQEL